MVLRFDDLEVGSIYEIDASQSASVAFFEKYRQKLFSKGVKYIRIKSLVNLRIKAFYIDALDDKFQDISIGGAPTIGSASNLVIIRKVPNVEIQQLKIQDTISNKAKYQAIKDVVGKRVGIDTMDAGLGMFVDRKIAPPKQSGVGRTRKSKKSKRKTHKRK